MESSLNIYKATRNYGKLVKKQVTGKDGKTHTVWVDPNKGKPSDKDSKVQQKTQKKKSIKDTNEKQSKHSEKEIAKIKEITQRHTEFETQLKDQRKAYGSGPVMPEVGAIMRVYAKGKANIGGMLGKIKNIAKDGKSAIVQLTSGGFYSFPMIDLQIAKSSLMVDIQKARAVKYVKRIRAKGGKQKYRYFYTLKEYKEYREEQKRIKEAVKNQKSQNAKAKQAKEPKKESPKAPVTRGVRLEKDKVPAHIGNLPKAESIPHLQPKSAKENNFETMPEASATPQVEVFDDNEPKTVQEFMGLPDAKNVSELSSNVKEILSRYSGKKMGVFQANKYLVENKELGYEWMKSIDIASQEKLDLYLQKLHTKARSEKAKTEKPQKEKTSKFFQDLEFAKLEDFIDKVVAGTKAKKQKTPVEQKPVIPQLINTKITEADTLFQMIQASVPKNPSNFTLSSNGYYLTINGQIFKSGDILTLSERQFTPKRKNAKTITIPEQKVKVSKFYQDNRMNDVVRVSYLFKDENGDTVDADETWNKFKELDIANITQANTGEPKTMIGKKLLLHGKVVEVVKQKPSPIGMFYSVKDGNGKILPMMLETNFKPLQTEGTKQIKIAEVVKNTKKPAVPKPQENNFETMPEVEQDGINYRHEIEKLKNKKFKTANDEKLIKLYEKRLNADVSKFKIGDGVQYNLLGQTNKGVILSVDQSTGMATIRLKGGFANLDQYGNYTDNPIVSVHVGDLKRHNALNQNNLTKIAEVVKNTKKPAVPETQENNFDTMPESKPEPKPIDTFPNSEPLIGKKGEKPQEERKEKTMRSEKEFLNILENGSKSEFGLIDENIREELTGYAKALYGQNWTFGNYDIQYRPDLGKFKVKEKKPTHIDPIQKQIESAFSRFNFEEHDL